MSVLVERAARPEPVYPESDGRPMADNTLQFQWIVTIEGGLDALFRDDPSVFVAGDLLWYPVEGSPQICAAPDAMVVFGRPKGHRGSYLQWREDGIPPQVVFEVLSPGNRPADLVQKSLFYEQYRVEEYYLYDPQSGDLAGWLSKDGRLDAVPEMKGWVSPRLGVCFDLEGKDLRLTGPDGQRFRSYMELVIERDQAALRVQQLEARLREAGMDPG